MSESRQGYGFERLHKIMREIKAIAKRYVQLTGRPLGVTGEIAERTRPAFNFEVQSDWQYYLAQGDGTR